MEINETPLPGVGIRYDFSTRDRHQLAVVIHHSGRRDLIIYDREDPDAGRDLVSFEESEADDLAELFGAARITGALADLQQRIEGLAIDWLPIRAGSQFADRPLGDTQARTRTGVSIVAALRDGKAFPAIGPDFILKAQDVVVVVGTPEGVTSLRQILGS